MDTAVVSTGISLQNILFATDFSSCSDVALSYATGLCQRYGSTLYTVHVVREELSDGQPPIPFLLLHSAEEKMESLVAADPFRGVKHRELLREGDVAQVLSDVIEGLEIDLLVLGTHGRGGFKKLLLGSVAEEIVGFASCPVLTVGPHVSGFPTVYTSQVSHVAVQFIYFIRRVAGLLMKVIDILCNNTGQLAHFLQFGNSMMSSVRFGIGYQASLEEYVPLFFSGFRTRQEFLYGKIFRIEFGPYPTGAAKIGDA